MDNLKYLLEATSLVASSLPLKASGSDWKSLEVRVPSPDLQSHSPFLLPSPQMSGRVGGFQVPSPSNGTGSVLTFWGEGTYRNL